MSKQEYKNTENQPLWYDHIESKSFLSEDKNLFVPMHMDTLVVGKESTKENRRKWKPIVVNYRNLTNDIDYGGLGKFITTPVDKDPNHKDKLENGVHLHWVLPKAFRHGEQLKNEGAPSFPLIPNRWLIIRTIVSDKTEDDSFSLDQKTWIMESDAEMANGKEKNWVELIQAHPGQNLVPGIDELQVKNIGKITDFNPTTWTDNVSKELFLNIQAPGNPSFAASYNASKGILGFHDNMKETEPGKYTYFVCGWYSNPTQDVFNNFSQVPNTSKTKDVEVLNDVELWLNKMKEFNWKLDGLNEKTTLELPRQLLCHSMAYGVDWKGTGGVKEKEVVYSNNIPNKKNVKIGIGNSGTEAMSALVLEAIGLDNQRTLDNLLSAFQYNQLTKYEPESGLRSLIDEIHNQRFHPFDGGHIWVIEKKEKNNLTDKTLNEISLDPFPEKISNLLHTINTQQEEYDRGLDELKAIQNQAYADWFKKVLINTRDLVPNEDDDEYDRAISKVEDLLNKNIEKIEAIKNKLIDLKQKPPIDENKSEDYGLVEDLKLQTGTIPKNLRELINLLESEDYKDLDLCVKESKMPRYYMPNDPSIVITGAEGQGGKYNNEGALLCRLESQLIDTIHLLEIKVPITRLLKKYGFLDEEDNEISFLKNKFLPSGVQHIFKESLLLDPQLSPLVAPEAFKISKGDSPSTNELENLIAAIQGYIEKPEKSVFLNHDKPAVFPESFSTGVAIQAWTPLFIEWGVTWEPSSPNGKVFNYSGRVMATMAFKNKVQDLLESIPKLDINKTSNFEPLSQSISGFTSNLIMQEHYIQLPPLKFDSATNKITIDELITTIGDQYRWNPAPGKYSTSNKHAFFPHQAGTLSFNWIRVIDAFGQVLTLKVTDPLKSQWIISKSLKTTSKNKIELPVRIRQASRLRFKWILANCKKIIAEIDQLEQKKYTKLQNFTLTEVEKLKIEAWYKEEILKINKRETDSDPGTSPILGWIIPNKLEKSIIIFDPHGNTCGQIHLDKSKKGISASYENITIHPKLQNFVNSLSKESFTGLLNLIESLNEKGKYTNAGNAIGLSVPIDNPIALVNTALKLELKEPYVQNQGWHSDSDTDPYSDVDFPVIVGDGSKLKNGLIGFFKDGNFEKMHLPSGKSDAKPKSYFKENQKLNLKVGVETNLVLLMDPRLGVHVCSDIVPSTYHEVPANFLTKPLKNFSLSFLVNPILTFSGSIQIPLPKIENKQWAWVSPPEGNKTKVEEVEIEPAKEKGLLFEPLLLKEGWLKLNPIKTKL